MLPDAVLQTDLPTEGYKHTVWRIYLYLCYTLCAKRAIKHSLKDSLNPYTKNGDDNEDDKKNTNSVLTDERNVLHEYTHSEMLELHVDF